MTGQPNPMPATDHPGPAPFEKLAAGLAVIWVITVVAQVSLAPESMLTGPLSFLMMILVALLPLALLWGIVITARTIRSLRAEAGQLRIAVDQMQHAYEGRPQDPNAKPMLEKKLDEIAAAQRKTESALAMFTSRRDTALTVPSADRKAALTMPVKVQGDEQAALALGTPAEDLRAPLSVGDFVRALHFPESAEDKAGFRALRLALEDRKTSRLIRAAQDVLTLLSQEGIYMDDLKPERCRPEVWRRFASGERGREIASLGGIRDRSSLALSSARMREDPIFRDAAHHFLRSFDKTFAEFEQNATDSELADLAETRTARAFMLLGRVTGTFD
ncbi:hypothetical protein EOK75_11295 [Pseudorhodobacter turbinis]|uniref:Uncharacterized protein n=1 Tax=Pseudorhodobacter turbinis TaxID=2500533 RepID=A0A4P8EI31_9RHOB|nr:hypothetical protein [Pseudorhodobacter turbinis]QCO56265.1 hypothetical protein EOK75_11295 [Pseudorhodobacter turbinis]